MRTIVVLAGILILCFWSLYCISSGYEFALETAIKHRVILYKGTAYSVQFEKNYNTLEEK